MQDLNTLTDSLQDLTTIRHEVTTSPTPASKIIQVYTENIIDPANTFSASVGAGANDATFEGNVTTLGALLRTENDMSQQRAILFAALSSPTAYAAARGPDRPDAGLPAAAADQADFTGSTSTAEQQNFSNTVSGPSVDLAPPRKALPKSMASAKPARR